MTRRARRHFGLALLLAAALGTNAGAAPPHAASASRPTTGQKLPRFVSLRSDTVNLRVGPGTRYPIAWVLHRRSLPVEVLREFKDWRAIRIPDGTRGWVHRSTLVARRSLCVKSGPERILRADASHASEALARIRAGVVGHIMSCAADAEWCQVEIAHIQGFMKRDAFWGTFPAEAVPG